MKYYATFYAPGTFVSETETLEIENPNNYKQIIEQGKNLSFRYNAKPYCFTTHYKDNHGNKTKESPRVFFGVKIRTIEDVIKDNLPDEAILRSNMISNKMKRIAEPINGYKSSIALNDDDIIV